MYFISREGFIVSTKEPEAWLKEAAELLNRGNYEGARTHALKALSWYQTKAGTTADMNAGVGCYVGEGNSLYQLGMNYYERKEWKEALRFFKEARIAYHRANPVITADKDF